MVFIVSNLRTSGHWHTLICCPPSKYGSILPHLSHFFYGGVEKLHKPLAFCGITTFISCREMSSFSYSTSLFVVASKRSHCWHHNSCIQVQLILSFFAAKFGFGPETSCFSLWLCTSCSTTCANSSNSSLRLLISLGFSKGTPVRLTSLGRSHRNQWILTKYHTISVPFI